MIRSSALGLCLCLCLCLCACTDGNLTPARLEKPETPAVALNTDACAIALTVHSGTSINDREIARFQRLALRSPQSLDYLERLGWAYVAKARASFDPGFYKLAEQTALCLHANQTDSPQGFLLRGHVLHNLHQFKQAEVLAYKLVDLRGLWFDYALLGDVLMERGKFSEAVEAYQQMMDLRPGPQAYQRAAHVRWLKGDLEGAIELMRMSVGASGFREPEAAAWAYLRLAAYEQQAGLAQQASNHIDSSLKLQADYAPALSARGRMLLTEGHNAEAIRFLTHAAELNPLVEYQWALIEALRTAGHIDEADQVEARLMQQGAVEDRRTFVLYLASTRKHVEKALELARKELDLRSDVFTLDAMAWALHAAGRVQEAYAYSRRALAEGTQDARLFYHAGAIAAAAGRSKEARQWLGKAAAAPHLLLPSERAQLTQEFAAIESRISNSAS